MRTIIPWIILVVAISINPVHLIAQDNVEEVQKTYKVETKDGNEFIGTIIREDDKTIVLKTQILGEITINRENILRIREIDQSKIIEGVLWDDNPQSSRYLWTPNGYGLKEGEGYYQNIWVLYNQLSYGLSDYFSVSGGLIPLFLFGEGGNTPAWIVPKFSIPISAEKVNIAAGAFVGTVLGENDANFGIVFSTLTLGNRNSNVNLGLGWGYAFGSWSDKPIINLSGMARISPRGYLMTENYYIETTVILSGGYRFLTKKVGIDFGLYLFVDEGFGFPVVGVTIPFEKK
jgi:hypothetical protein